MSDLITSLSEDPTCDITHLCRFLRKHGLRLADDANYTESLPQPSNDPVAILTAVSACGDAHLTIVDDSDASAGWVYLIMPPAVSPEECVANYGINPLTETWAKEYDDFMGEYNLSSEGDYPDYPTMEDEDGPYWESDGYARWLDRQ